MQGRYRGGGNIPDSLPEGLSIVDGSGIVIPENQASTWNEGMGLTGIGVSSSDYGHSFIFGVADTIASSHVDDGSINTRKEWSAYLYDTPVGNGVTSTTDKGTAGTDFRSKENTDAIIAAMGDIVETDNAARVCRNYSAGVIGAGQWDLPALGVLNFINDYFRTSIINLMTTIGKSYWTLLKDQIWSSTEYGPSRTWGFDFDRKTSRFNRRDTNLFVIPVYTIN